MATRSRYQYETSPRKLEPKYTAKKTIKKKNVKQKQNKKAKKIIYIIFAFSILFAISYRNSQIDENFSKVQKLKQELSQIKKENEQLNVGIQNSLNLSQVEKTAKELLGMQKLTSKQTIYVNLPKKDYVEPATEEVIMEENKNWIESLLEKIFGN